MADVDVDPGCTLNKKIRNAQLAQYNFILGNILVTLYWLTLLLQGLIILSARQRVVISVLGQFVPKSLHCREPLLLTS